MERCKVIKRNISESDFAEILRVQRLRCIKEQAAEQQSMEQAGTTAFDKTLKGSKCFLKSRKLLKI